MCANGITAHPRTLRHLKCVFCLTDPFLRRSVPQPLEFAHPVALSHKEHPDTDSETHPVNGCAKPPAFHPTVPPLYLAEKRNRCALKLIDDASHFVSGNILAHASLPRPKSMLNRCGYTSLVHQDVNRRLALGAHQRQSLLLGSWPFSVWSSWYIHAVTQRARMDLHPDTAGVAIAERHWSWLGWVRVECQDLVMKPVQLIQLGS